MPKKLTYEHIKNKLETIYDVISNKSEYINTKSKIRVRCKHKGHISELLYNNFQQGHGCKKCSTEKNSKKRKHSYNFVVNQAKKRGYEFASDEYKNNSTKHQYKCHKGHLFYMTYSDINGGHGCPECYSIKSSNKQRLSFDEIIKRVEEREYEILSTESDYKNQHSRLKLKCKKGHIFLILAGNFFNNNCGCVACNGKSSKAEKEIVEYIDKLNINTIENDRTQIRSTLTNRPLELDIFIPELNKAIEFNGKYWHSFEDRKQNDKIKKQQCKKKGIDLLIIKEQDWIDDKDLCFCDINEFLLKM